MNVCTLHRVATSSAQLPAVFFEAPRREAELRPVAPISVERPIAPDVARAREEQQALGFALTLGLTALITWGALLQTLVTSLRVPSLL